MKNPFRVLVIMMIYFFWVLVTLAVATIPGFELLACAAPVVGLAGVMAWDKVTR